MNKKDYLKEWFRELPAEQAPPDFSIKVMQRVMSEWSLNPYKYQPIISKKAWWTICLMAFVITGMLFSIHSSMPNTYTDEHLQGFGGINLSNIFSVFSRYFNKLNNISPAVAIGTLAIIALWFFDQLFTWAVKH